MSKASGILLTEDGIILSGYQKKLKTMKKKFFVLYKETLCNVPRLEYYDSEKKFKSGLAPKRVIKLKNCFNINRRFDTKHDYVIALSTKDGGFGIVLESEPEMLKWLELLISLQRCNSSFSDSLQTHYEYMWQVLVQKKGLAEDKGIFGQYHVGLTQKSITLIRIGPEKTACGDTRKSNVEFLLTTIRRCGDSQCVFYMEVGRQSVIGPGELWMETEDTLVAQNMHYMILSAMSTKGDQSLEPMRKRSSSANEASKPINVLQKQLLHTDHNVVTTNSYFGRDRSDSLPSRNRTLSECSNQNITSNSNIRSSTMAGLRMHRHGNSPPMNKVLGCSESEESSISIEEPEDNGTFLMYRLSSRASKGVIPEENSDELTCAETKCNEDAFDKRNDSTFCSLELKGKSEEDYIAMAPVKASKVLPQLKDNSKYCPATCTHEYDNKLQFPEYTSDVFKNLEYAYEANSQLELPSRTYSIGNKTEHTAKRNMSSNEAEHNTIRVRAFSVGSRAKIPRCDLQRGILYSKATIETSFNGSNNNVLSVTEPGIYNPLLSLNTVREKKSVSAPLLIHKSHNSVDHMSDLMEIDFSKSSNNIKTQPTDIKSKTFVKNSFNLDTDKNNKSINQLSFLDLPVSNVIKSSPPTTNTVTRTDNGYLEMKPVGNLSQTNFAVNNSQPTREPKQLISKQKMMHTTDVMNINNAVLSNANTTSITSTNNVTNLEKQNLDNVQRSTKDGHRTEFPYNTSTTNCGSNKMHCPTESSNLSSKYAELSLKPRSHNKNAKSSEDEYINIKGNFNESICRNLKRLTEDNVVKAQNSHEKPKINDSENKTEYTKSNTTNNQSRYQDSNTNKTHNKPTSTNNIFLSVSTSCSTPGLCGSTSSSSASASTSSLNCLPLSHAQSTLPKELNSTKNLSGSQARGNALSRPSSVNSEHELYYASLDLPQCSTEVKTRVYSDIPTEPVIHITDINNSYAKIEFDHSDSSSSSSKNINI